VRLPASWTLRRSSPRRTSWWWWRRTRHRRHWTWHHPRLARSWPTWQPTSPANPTPLRQTSCGRTCPHSLAGQPFTSCGACPKRMRPRSMRTGQATRHGCASRMSWVPTATTMSPHASRTSTLLRVMSSPTQWTHQRARQGTCCTSCRRRTRPRRASHRTWQRVPQTGQAWPRSVSTAASTVCSCRPVPQPSSQR